ncbi:MAG: ABC transporter substrate-binding protein [Candidatus Schekmanbacteria bacterium]|nr:ABC transporter substrate-binding protein [Candidatus Schekmanbacteria bacterium]
MQSSKNKIIEIVMLITLTAVFSNTFQGMSYAKNLRVAVIKSFASTPFEETLSGFKESLKKEEIEADFEIFSANGDPIKVREAVQQIKSGDFSLVFTMGSLATDNALTEITNIPIVSSMILKDDKIKKTPNATGVVLEFSIETQLKCMQQILPKGITIGTIYNSKENGKFVETAAAIAKSMGYKFYAKEINTPQDLPSALESMANSVDVLWGIPDSMVLTPETSKHILLFSLRNRIPFIGLSSAWTKAGALYSLERNYNDIGIQCAELALSLLRNQKERATNPVPPRKALYSINFKTAQQLKIEIPENIINGAIQVY